MKYYIPLLLAFAFILSSCSKVSMNFAKRKYRTGYYMDFSSFKNSKNYKEHITIKNSLTRIINIAPRFPVKDAELLTYKNDNSQLDLKQRKEITQTIPVFNRITTGVIENNYQYEKPDKDPIKQKGFIFLFLTGLFAALTILKGYYIGISFTPFAPVILVSLFLLCIISYIIYVTINKKYFDEKRAENKLHPPSFENKISTASIISLIFAFINIGIVVLAIFATCYFLFFLLYSLFPSYIFGFAALEQNHKHPEMKRKWMPVFSLITITFILLMIIILINTFHFVLPS